MKKPYTPDKSGHAEDLEPFFTASRENGPAPTQGLLDRVLRDGESLQPEPVGIMAAQDGPRAGFRPFRTSFGGWVSAGALTACLLIGLSLGYMPPEGFVAVTDALLNSAGIDTDDGEYTTLDDLVTEG